MRRLELGDYAPGEAFKFAQTFDFARNDPIPQSMMTILPVAREAAGNASSQVSAAGEEAARKLIAVRSIARNVSAARTRTGIRGETTRW